MAMDSAADGRRRRLSLAITLITLPEF